jgi:hypothetical protein
MNFKFFVLFLLFSIQAIASPGFHQPWGRDAELNAPPPSKEPETLSAATRIADAVIRFHQTVISPVDGPRSHYRPSSSSYMSQAMHRYGFLRGFIMGCDRLLRENDEEWVYRKIEVDGQMFKYDPASENKYR